MQYNSNYEQQQWNTNQQSTMQSPQIDQTGLSTTSGDDSLGAIAPGPASQQKSTERMRHDEGELTDVLYHL